MIFCLKKRLMFLLKLNHLMSNKFFLREKLHLIKNFNLKVIINMVKNIIKMKDHGI